MKKNKIFVACDSANLEKIKNIIKKFILTFNPNNKKIKIEDKIISDSCEPLIGAIYLDKGLKIANEFILNMWSDYLKTSNFTRVDSKTKLQEFSLKKFKSLPVYKIISNTGPRHKPSFKVGVKIKNSKSNNRNLMKKSKTKKVTRK